LLCRDFSPVPPFLGWGGEGKGGWGGLECGGSGGGGLYWNIVTESAYVAYDDDRIESTQISGNKEGAHLQKYGGLIF